ncbi:hypothetical protein P171DRAFT_482751 [Karstenula rhodostoma CBS 690.94]|uniref:Uncharacterized protein n=1 Tax=Karstenula rhodostoma CBS 690.94 TaxID=1392251 RepID=A0A9P4PSB2_9PLEO|nr:hypothetical protein P171DRAFT_482751 [Karstenula rhodostoma CBS 690.94]
MEEINLQFPTCDAVWRGEDLSISLCLQIIEHDQTPSQELWAADIFRIAMDQNEPLPRLDPAGQELLMFGLVYPIWCFSKDRDVFARLTNNTNGLFDSDPTPPEASAVSVGNMRTEPARRRGEIAKIAPLPSTSLKHMAWKLRDGK